MPTCQTEKKIAPSIKTTSLGITNLVINHSSSPCYHQEAFALMGLIRLIYLFICLFCIVCYLYGPFFLQFSFSNMYHEKIRCSYIDGKRFRKISNRTIRFFMFACPSVRPSVLLHGIRLPLNGLHEICDLGIFLKFFRKLKFFLKKLTIITGTLRGKTIIHF